MGSYTSDGSAVVGHSPLHFKVNGSNLGTVVASGRAKKWGKRFIVLAFKLSSHWAHIPVTVAQW